MKLVETIGIQKKALEDENEELKSRISDMMAERSGYGTGMQIDMDKAAFGANAMRNGVPLLNLNNGGNYM